MKDFWNARYKNEEFAYGKSPNEFLKQVIDKLNLTGSILLPAEGEGRNAIYAAKKGLEVTAFDISEEAKNKAIKWATSENVDLDYKLGSIEHLDFEKHSFDVLALIYAHFPADKKEAFYTGLGQLVKPHGHLILEGFSVNNLKLRGEKPYVGGLGDVNMLFTQAEIETIFKDFEILELQEVEVELNEGEFHNGLASVIRFVGRKKG